SVGCKCPNKLTVLLLDLQAGTDFHRNILAVGIVNQVLEGNDKGIRLRIAGQAVVSIIDRDETDAKLGKNLLKVTATVDIVSRKAAEVFDHNAINPALADCLFQLLEVRTIKGNAAVPIVNERVADHFQIVVPCDIVFADRPLAG